ncbi:fatty acid desaturase CarF family protein [Aquirhabdus sp.]|uniref:fatty acid desaturase CarF family protein n=1 Tax=Aquirhabdus sp. TaxID=2824160 RepID=UPI00396CBE0D
MLRRIAFVIFFSSVALNFAWLGFMSFDWKIIPAALIAWYLADALSGVIHMYMDYRPCTENVGLGQLFFYEGSRESEEYLSMRRAAMARISFFERVVFDFKNHHPRPLALGRRSFIYQTTSIMVFVFPLSVLLNIVCSLWTLPSWLLVGLDILLLGMILTQYFHGTLHRDDNPWIIHAMRKTTLLMTPTMHDIHHATLDRDFATINGWSNPAVNIIFNYFKQQGKMDRSGLEPN